MPEYEYEDDEEEDDDEVEDVVVAVVDDDAIDEHYTELAPKSPLSATEEDETPIHVDDG